MTDSKTQIAFIGAGDISLLHAEAINNHIPDAELIGLWSIDDTLNQEKSDLFGCRIYESAEALVNDPDVDAVFILTNLETHTEYATLAMNAGKAVLVEKPVAPTIPELLELQKCAGKNGVLIYPGHNYIHEPGLARTKELLDSGKLGQLASIYIHYHIQHPEEVAKRYPGVIRHILTHHAYLLLYLAGEDNWPEAVSAMKSVIHYKEFQEEDLAMVNIRLRSGALVHLCADFAADDHSGDPWTFMIKVIGTEGATRFSYRDWVENKPGVVHSHTWSAYEFHIRNEIADFVKCVRVGGEPPSTIEDAMMCQRIVEAVEYSILERGEIEL